MGGTKEGGEGGQLETKGQEQTKMRGGPLETDGGRGPLETKGQKQTGGQTGTQCSV